MDDPIRVTAEEKGQEKIPVGEAIRLCLKALDRLETVVGREAQQAILADVNRYIEAVQSQDPENPWLFFLFGRAYASVGQSYDAIKQLHDFVETREGRNEWLAFRMLGDLFAKEFPWQAKAHYEAALALKPGNPTILLGLSNCASKLGKTEEALRHAQGASAADRTRDPRYATRVARVLLDLDRLDESEREALRGLELAKADMERLSGHRDAVQAVHTQYELLMDIVQAKLSANPEIADEYLRLAKYVRGRAAMAARLQKYDVLNVLELGVQDATTGLKTRLLEEFAVLLAELGRNEEAVQRFRELLKLDPRNPIAKKWLEQLQAASPPSSKSKK